MPWAASGETVYEGEMMRCEYNRQGRPCGRDAVAYYENERGNDRPICAGHLAMLQKWDSEIEIGPIGNLIHPDPAIAWQEKHAAATLEEVEV